MYCKRNNLIPFQDWINLFDKNIFLLGPFNFATFDSKQSKDRISNDVWKNLQKLSSKFDNSIPNSEDLDHLVFYMDTCFHSIHEK